MAPTELRLPSPAEEFLRTADGRWCRQPVKLFHRWMSAHSLVLSDLTPAHLEQFWEQRSRNLASSTLYTHRCLFHKYLYWLDGKGLLRFAVDPPRLRHIRLTLPEPARRFLKLSAGQRQEHAVRNFHHWLQPKSIALSELTPAHLDAFLRRPIATQLVKSSSKRLHRHLEPYLVWLYEQGLVLFRADRDGRKPFPLPDSAQDFVDILRPVRKPNTCAGYVGDLRDLHAWIATQGLCIETLNRHDMERWLKSLADRGLAPVTRNTRIFRARSYLRWLAGRGMTAGDPDDLLRASDLPKIPTYLPRPFPVEADRTLQRRFRECGTVYGQALFLMRRSGVRIGELLGLERDCRRENLHGNIFMKVPLGKLDNERLVPLDDETNKVILSLQQQCPRNARFLILPELDRQTLRKRLSDDLKASAADLDIPGPVVSHRLRHTYATELLNAGMTLVGLMKLLGHRSLRMTMRYAAITQETVVKSYYAALAKISPQYDLPTAHPKPINEPDPDQMLRDVISYLRNITTAKNRTQRLITRIHKIRHDIAQLTDESLQD